MTNQKRKHSNLMGYVEFKFNEMFVRISITYSSSQSSININFNITEVIYPTVWMDCVIYLNIISQSTVRTVNIKIHVTHLSEKHSEFTTFSYRIDAYRLFPVWFYGTYNQGLFWGKRFSIIFQFFLKFPIFLLGKP